MPGRLALLSALCCLAPVAGCGGPGTATVSGTVTVDGKPLGKGVISFAPADGVGSPATAEVVAGRYQLVTSPGAKKVRLSAPVVTGTSKESSARDAATFDITEESLPAKYNAVTELAYDAPPGVGTKDWAVESRRKKK